MLRIAVGLLILFLFLLFVVFWLQIPLWRDGYRSANLSNVKQLNLAVLMYQADNDGRLPPQMSTMEQLQPLLIEYTIYEEIFQTVNKRGSEFLGNERLAGRLYDSVVDPDKTIMFYDSELWKNTGERACVMVNGSAKYVDDRYFKWGLKVEFNESSGS